MEELAEVLDDVVNTRPPYRWEALVACEIVARLQGRWGKRNAYSEKVDEWILRQRGQPPDELVNLAINAIDSIIRQAPSEAHYWTHEDARAYRIYLKDLRRRVAGTPSPDSGDDGTAVLVLLIHKATS